MIQIRPLIFSMDDYNEINNEELRDWIADWAFMHYDAVVNTVLEDSDVKRIITDSLKDQVLSMKGEYFILCLDQKEAQHLNN